RPPALAVGRQPDDRLVAPAGGAVPGGHEPGAAVERPDGRQAVARLEDVDRLEGLAVGGAPQHRAVLDPTLDQADLAVARAGAQPAGAAGGHRRALDPGPAAPAGPPGDRLGPAVAPVRPADDQ